MKIAQNDTTLAHSVANRIYAKEAVLFDSNINTAIHSKTKSNYKRFVTGFGDNIISTVMIKPNGSREQWSVIGLAWDDNHIKMVINVCIKARVSTGTLAEFSTHAIARMIQRTINNDDVSNIKENVGKLCQGLLGIILRENLLNTAGVTEGVKVALYMKEGMFLGTYTDKTFYFKTWLDAENASNPQVTALCNKEKQGMGLSIGFTL